MSPMGLLQTVLSTNPEKKQIAVFFVFAANKQTTQDMLHLENVYL